MLWSYVPPAFTNAEIEPTFVALKQAATALGMEAKVVQVASEAGVQSALNTIAAGRAAHSTAFQV